MVLARLRATIQRAAPEAEEAISYGMPAFKLHGILVWFAAHTFLHVGFYPRVTVHFERSRRNSLGSSRRRGSVHFPFDEAFTDLARDEDGEVQGRGEYEEASREEETSREEEVRGAGKQGGVRFSRIHAAPPDVETTYLPSGDVVQIRRQRVTAEEEIDDTAASGRLAVGLLCFAAAASPGMIEKSHHMLYMGTKRAMAERDPPVMALRSLTTSPK